MTTFKSHFLFVLKDTFHAFYFFGGIFLFFISYHLQGSALQDCRNTLYNYCMPSWKDNVQNFESTKLVSILPPRMSLIHCEKEKRHRDSSVIIVITSYFPSYMIYKEITSNFTSLNRQV